MTNTQLSFREQTIAARYSAGETYKEVARDLNIAPATVRNHIAAIYRKLKVKNKPQMIQALAAGQIADRQLSRGEPGAATMRILQNLDDAGPPPRRGASIAVMPFRTIGPAETDYFSHGVTADIQHDLTRCHDLLVSGRSSCQAISGPASDAMMVAKRLGVQYVLQGTVRSNGNKIRLITELVDGIAGNVLWSERYDSALHDIFEVEAEIANAIVANLSLQLDEAQYQRQLRLSSAQLSAYDFRLRGNRCVELGGRDNLNRAKSHFKNALKLEPNSAPAYSGLSLCFGYQCDLLLTADYGESLERHIAYAEQAVAIDEFDSRSHYAMACARLLNREFERADRHAERALQLNPSEYHNFCNRGYTQLSLGRVDESLACFDDSLRRNPLAPNSCLLALGLLDYLTTNYDQSTATLSRMTAAYVQKASTLAAAFAQLGSGDEARAATQEFKQISDEIPLLPNGKDRSNWRSFWRQAYPYIKDDAFECVIDGLDKAGLPV